MLPTRSFRTLPYLVGLVLAVAPPALAQERLIVVRDAGQLLELDTSDARLGAVIQAAPLPQVTNALRVAGGRYLLLHRQSTAFRAMPLPRSQCSIPARSINR